MDSNTLLEAEKNQIWIPSVTFVNTARQVFASGDDQIVKNEEIAWYLYIAILGEKFEGQLLPGDRGKELKISSATIIFNISIILSFCICQGRGNGKKQ